MASPHTSPLNDVRQAMAATNELFTREVIGRRNFSMLDEVYTADAQILPPGAPKISGRDAIKQFWTDLVSSANAKSVTLASDDVINAGDGVVEIGHATLVLEAAEISAKYVVYWRQEQGRWKWHVDIWNANS